MTKALVPGWLAKSCRADVKSAPAGAGFEHNVREGDRRTSRRSSGWLGVIVGGLLSAVASYLASRSLEGRRIAAHRRAAARLVNQELKRDALTIGRIRGVAHFQPQERSEPEASDQPEAALALPTQKRADWRTLKLDLDDRLPKVTSDVWETHQPTLAEVLRDSEWQAVEKAYEA